MFTIEKTIKRILASKKMKIGELAKRSKISRTTIYEIFKTNDPKISQLESIAQALGVHPLDLMEYNDPEREYERIMNGVLPLHEAIVDNLIEELSNKVKGTNSNREEIKQIFELLEKHQAESKRLIDKAKALVDIEKVQYEELRKEINQNKSSQDES